MIDVHTNSLFLHRFNIKGDGLVKIWEVRVWLNGNRTYVILVCDAGCGCTRVHTFFLNPIQIRSGHGGMRSQRKKEEEID